jgi:predicted transcriptional regulator
VCGAQLRAAVAVNPYEAIVQQAVAQIPCGHTIEEIEAELGKSRQRQPE